MKAFKPILNQKKYEPDYRKGVRACVCVLKVFVFSSIVQITQTFLVEKEK